MKDAILSQKMLQIFQKVQSHPINQALNMFLSKYNKFHRQNYKENNNNKISPFNLQISEIVKLGKNCKTL